MAGRRSPSSPRRWLGRCLVATVAALAFAGVATAEELGRRLILVTLDGLNWTEVFHGADADRAADPAFTAERDLIRREFVEKPDRAAALMPFLHGVVARDGVLIGDRDHGSCMAVANSQWFSYPGYNEVLTGRPDPAIISNDHGPNANVTFLEWLNRQPAFAGKVSVVTSWNAFSDILNASRSGVALNAGWEGGLGPAAPQDRARLQRDAPHLWPVARLDAFTHAWALDALTQAKPRVLYVAYNDTDDFAHEGRYDQTLWAARRADRFLEELWRAAESDPASRGRTVLIVTVDHGRGIQGKDAWRSHGAAFAGSDATWVAAIGPGIRARATPTGPCASSSQVAATALTALGLDWRDYDPRAGAPLQVVETPGP